jgi:hypothetical protein
LKCGRLGFWAMMDNFSVNLGNSSPRNGIICSCRVEKLRITAARAEKQNNNKTKYTAYQNRKIYAYKGLSKKIQHSCHECSRLFFFLCKIRKSFPVTLHGITYFPVCTRRSISSTRALSIAAHLIQ